MNIDNASADERFFDKRIMTLLQYSIYVATTPPLNNGCLYGIHYSMVEKGPANMPAGIGSRSPHKLRNMRKITQLGDQVSDSERSLSNKT